MSKILHLNVKKKYFYAIKAGYKTFEFRKQTDYWRKRLAGKEYEEVWIKLGYPKNTDTERIIKRRWKGYKEISIFHREFGDTPVEVFAIDVSEGDKKASVFFEPCPDCGFEEAYYTRKYWIVHKGHPSVGVFWEKIEGSYELFCSDCDTGFMQCDSCQTLIDMYWMGEGYDVPDDMFLCPDCAKNINEKEE